MQSIDHSARSFFMKDLFDQGLAIVKGLPFCDLGNSASILEGYNLMDQAEGPDGKPNYDYYIWTGLARLLISAGDLSHAAVKVTVSRPAETAAGYRWDFAYELGREDLDRPFISLFPIASPSDQIIDPSSIVDSRDMGPIVSTEEYIPKLGAYPLMVNPAMGRRSTAALNFILASALRMTGLTVHSHWTPVNTAEGAAIYVMSDGITCYQMTYDGPALERAMAEIDQRAGRTEEDGAVLLNADVPVDADGLDVANDETSEDIEYTADDHTDLSAGHHIDLTGGLPQ